MNVWLAVAAGGALGAVLRYAVLRLLGGGSGIAWATFGVNAVGSVAAGVLFVLLAQRLSDEDPLRGFLMIGLLGAMTTFSTFSLDTVRLMLAGAYGPAAANVLLNLAVCLLGCWLGIVATRQLLA